MKAWLLPTGREEEKETRPTYNNNMWGFLCRVPRWSSYLTLLPPWQEISPPPKKKKFVCFPAERWSEACSASELCSCVQLVGETLLWLSALPNRLGQEGASEGSQRGSPVLPLIKHISVVSQKGTLEFIQHEHQWRPSCITIKKSLLIFFLSPTLWPNTIEGISASWGWVVKWESSSELGKSPIPRTRAICHQHNGTRKHERILSFIHQGTHDELNRH